jgi:hypothetical protein
MAPQATTPIPALTQAASKCSTMYTILDSHLLRRSCSGDMWDNGVDDEDATWRDLERAAQLTNR